MIWHTVEKGKNKISLIGFVADGEICLNLSSRRSAFDIHKQIVVLISCRAMESAFSRISSKIFCRNIFDTSLNDLWMYSFGFPVFNPCVNQFEDINAENATMLVLGISPRLRIQTLSDFSDIFCYGLEGVRDGIIRKGDIIYLMRYVIGRNIGIFPDRCALGSYSEIIETIRTTDLSKTNIDVDNDTLISTLNSVRR